MGYTIIDVLDKLIKVEENGHNMYAAIGAKDSIDVKTKLVLRVFEKEQNKHIVIYKKLREQAAKKNLEEIDFDIYDKVSNLISKFIYSYPENIVDVKDLLRFFFNLEKEKLALTISIQGLLVRRLKDMDSHAYNALTEIIKEKEKYVGDIQIFLK
ncbi:hypothetical protein CACET_c25280 [Clostridium aceticum]|uniref:Uncharacterized protein n=1 Tax=Clostridium aceticum TaxID=84022 RepID=A0A0D8ID07_9CLOT|nr:hypothetical protein [Clostridium aceticum]AKL95973.1 hypothetical protein CACET_c25280 [Clostridium aceticum]KJF27081.1 hypothetical protein TZ02_09790 [Clostridium aceticum]